MEIKKLKEINVFKISWIIITNIFVIYFIGTTMINWEKDPGVLLSIYGITCVGYIISECIKKTSQDN